MIKVLVVILIIYCLFYLLISKKLKVEYLFPLSNIFLAFPLSFYISVPLRIGGIPFQYLPLVLWGIKNIVFAMFNKKISFNKNLFSIVVFSVLFLLYGFMSLLWVPNLNSWFVYFGQWNIYILGILIGGTIALNDNFKRKKIIENYIYSIFFSNLLGLFNFFGLKLTSANPFLMINRNGAIFILLPALALLISHKDFFSKKSYYTMLITQISTILLIFSRTGYLSLLALFLLFGFFGNEKKGIFIVKYLKTIFIFIIPIIFTLFLVQRGLELNLIGNIIVRFKSITNGLNFVKGNIDGIGGDTRRAMLVQEGINIFKKRPIIGTGLGLENYLFYFNSYVGPKGPARSHSVYISYLAELGIVGFSIFMALILNINVKLYRLFRRNNDPYRNIINVNRSKGFLVGSFVLLIAFLTGEHITSPYVWFFWALGLSQS